MSKMSQKVMDNNSSKLVQNEYSMDRWRGKIAIVTGASSGIGEKIAKKLVEEGLLVVGLARRKEKIEELSSKLKGKPGKLYSYETNLRKENEIEAAFKWVKDNLGIVHILINNAGTAGLTSLYDGDTEVWKQTLEVNLLGTAIATREAVKVMRENNIAGHIIHVNSLAAHFSLNFPGLNIYPASKQGVTAMVETLRTELVELKSPIKISSISPGITDTPIFETCGHGKIPDNIPTLKPEDVAESIIFMLATPPHLQIQELILRAVGGSY